MDPRPHRKSLRRYEGEGDARFLTISCYKRLPLLGSDAIRDAYADHLSGCFDGNDDRVRLIAWVAMPEHVHLLLLPPVEVPIAGILQSVNGGFSFKVLKRWRELDAPISAKIMDGRGRPRYWQRGGGFDKNIADERAVGEVVDYIHANPVRRGLCDLPRQWRWSSAAWYDGLDYRGPTIRPAE